MNNHEKILAYVKNHPAGKVKIAYADTEGILRGKYISAEKFLSVVEKGAGFCDVVFGWDMGDIPYDYDGYTGWGHGFPDAPTKIVLDTFRKIPWENDLPFFLGEFYDKENKPQKLCPRQLFKKVIGQARDLGFEPYFSQEFEWFNFSETPQSAENKGWKNMTPLSPGMFGYSILRTTLNNDYFSDLFNLLSRFGIPIEGLHTETGPGVLEAAIQYSDALEAADRACLFKTAVKEIAYKHQVMATFMAKISDQLAGCGGHIHQSLWDLKTESNKFYDGDDPFGMSQIFRHYVAGQLYCLPHILPLYAPTINSYKRLVEGAWAPTTLTWGIDNRTVALRVITGGASSTRLETRVPGSDVNPYFAMAAALASGIYGIQNKLPLQDMTAGNGYLDHSQGHLPTTLYEAALKMKDSPLAKALLGEEFVNHYSRSRLWEWKQHLKIVTEWEFKRYFEII